MFHMHLFSKEYFFSKCTKKCEKCKRDIYLIHQWSAKNYKQCHLMSCCAVLSEFDLFFLLMCFIFSFSFSWCLCTLALHHNSKQHHSVLNVVAVSYVMSTSLKSKHCTTQWKMLLYVCWRRKQMCSDVPQPPNRKSIKSLRHFIPTQCLTLLC